MTGRVLIVGAGGLGGLTAALLWERHASGTPWNGAPEDAPIVALTSNPAIADAVRTGGCRIGGVDERERAVRTPIVEALPATSKPFDWIILAVQPPQVEEAARQTAPLLAESGRMVCFQNGLCEERVERIVGNGRVVGAVVAWGGSMPEPGRYVRTAKGGFTLGLASPNPTPTAIERDPSLDALAELLDPVGPVRITDNLRGARWSKLAINCAISTLGTLGGSTLGAVLMHRPARRLALEIMTEAVAVARKLDVSLEKIGGVDLEWLALGEEERRSSGSPSLLAKHSVLLAVGARYRRMRSSMLSAIERGRIPAVDFLNGEVAERGHALDIPTPVNREAQRMVHELALGRFKAGIEAVLALRDRTAKELR